MSDFAFNERRRLAANYRYSCQGLEESRAIEEKEDQLLKQYEKENEEHFNKHGEKLIEMYRNGGNKKEPIKTMPELIARFHQLVGEIKVLIRAKKASFRANKVVMPRAKKVVIRRVLTKRRKPVSLTKMMNNLFGVMPQQASLVDTVMTPLSSRSPSPPIVSFIDI